MTTNNEKARTIVRENRYLALATSLHSEPWIAALAYAVDEQFNFYWCSEKSARHSKHVESNKIAAGSIFNSQASSDEVDGLQMLGEVREVEVHDLPRIAELYYSQSFPDAETRKRWRKSLESFMGAASQRFYQFKPIEIFKCDLDNTSVDRRIKVDFLAD